MAAKHNCIFTIEKSPPFVNPVHSSKWLVYNTVLRCTLYCKLVVYRSLVNRPKVYTLVKYSREYKYNYVVYNLHVNYISWSGGVVPTFVYLRNCCRCTVRSLVCIHCIYIHDANLWPLAGVIISNYI